MFILTEVNWNRMSSGPSFVLLSSILTEFNLGGVISDSNLTLIKFIISVVLCGSRVLVGPSLICTELHLRLVIFKSSYIYTELHID